MSNHRINLIAALCAIAFCASPVLAQGTSGSSSSQQDVSSSSGSASGTSSSTSSTGSSADVSSSTPSASPSGSSASSYESSSNSGRAKASMSASSDSVRPANEDDQKRTASEYKGQKITGANGEDLGKVNDFVVDTQSGKVAFAVVSSGGFLGVGDKLRLVEHSSLQPQSAAEGFTAQMDKVAFEALPVITQQDLDAGKISADEKKAASGMGKSASSASRESQSSPSGQFALASKLSGKNARAGEIEAGSISDIVVNIENGQAHALFEPKSEFAGSSGKFLVPLSKFEVGSPQAQVIATTLARSDFGASGQASSSSSTAETLTPTGRTSSPSSSSSSPSAPSGSSRTIGSGTSSTSPASSSSLDTSTFSPSSSSSSDTRSGSTSSSGSSNSEVANVAPGSRSASKTGSSVADSSTGSAGASAASSSSGTGSSGVSTQTPSHTPDRATTTSSTVAGIGTTSSGTAVSTDEQLSPTGRTSAEQSSSDSISPSAIRSALQQDASLARENVQVETKIVLRGTVSSQAAKTKAEDLARHAAGSAEIDNQISVETK